MRVQPVPLGTTRPDELRDDPIQLVPLNKDEWLDESLLAMETNPPVRGKWDELTNEVACVCDISARGLGETH